MVFLIHTKLDVIPEETKKSNSWPVATETRLIRLRMMIMVMMIIIIIIIMTTMMIKIIIICKKTREDH